MCHSQISNQTQLTKVNLEKVPLQVRPTRPGHKSVDSWFNPRIILTRRKMLIWIIFGSFLVIVAFVVFSLFGFLRQSKVIDFAWGLSYTDSSLIGQVNELFKRELSVGLVNLTVVWNLREKFGINGKNGQWPVGLSRFVWFEIRFRSEWVLVWDFS